jgi:phage shock protein PspC (stress-responsive transcriptional regulator)
MARLYRSSTDKRIAGVCGGIATTYDIDPALVRLGFVIAILTPIPIIIFYLAATLILPKEQ